MSRSLKFARLVAEELRRSTIEPVHGKYIRVTGRLDTEVTIVSLRIDVWWDFRQVKSTPPIVYCSEPWMKIGPDWHNGPPLCWALPDEWRDAMSWRRKPVASIYEQGIDWMVKSVRNLINRHYSAHLEGYDTWPEEWDYWGHFKEGVREYHRGKRG